MTLGSLQNEGKFALGKLVGCIFLTWAIPTKKESLGFRDLGFRVWGLGIWELWFRVWGLGMCIFNQVANKFYTFIPLLAPYTSIVQYAPKPYSRYLGPYLKSSLVCLLVCG